MRSSKDIAVQFMEQLLKERGHYGLGGQLSELLRDYESACAREIATTPESQPPPWTGWTKGPVENLDRPYPFRPVKGPKR